jgi:hypothetical protein
METASDRFIADTIETTNDQALVAAAAQLHTTAWWLTAIDTPVVDWLRYDEARLAVVDNG